MNALLLARIFFGAFSTGLLVLAIGLELRWWRLRDATRQAGRIVDQIVEPGVEGGADYYPVIQVGAGADLIRFKSSYPKSEPFKIGDEVCVLFDPETKRSECYSVSNRYFPSLFLLAFAAVFGLLSVFIQK